MSATFLMMWLALQAPAPAPAPVPAQTPPPAAVPKVEPLPEGKQEKLQALVIAVEGKAEWKAAGAAAFKAAAVNDLLDAGAEIRTGLRSTVTLRVGKNATLVVDRASRVELPVMVQDGAVLRTRAAVYRGKCEFKVEAIAITSDFQVLTPSATLAVRGTGFTVEWGALAGVKVTGVDTNRVRAIELGYFANLQQVFVSGAGASSSPWPQPVDLALYRTVFPPPPPSLEVDGPDLLARGPGGYDGALPRESLLHLLQREREIDHGGSEIGRALGKFDTQGRPVKGH
jgi:hypothetical protein